MLKGHVQLRQNRNRGYEKSTVPSVAYNCRTRGIQGSLVNDSMKQPINRREFITASTVVAAGWSFGVPSAAETPSRGPGDRTIAQNSATPAAPLLFKTKPHKALIARPTEDDLKRLKTAAFDGVEGRS